MTPVEQIAAQDAAHAAIPYLNDILSLWEGMDAATTTDLDDPAHNAGIFDLRGNVGVAEMRDLCITLHPYLQQVYDAYAAEFGQFETAFDWEFIPMFIDLIDWTAVSYTNVFGHYQMTFTDLAPPAETARAIHERYSR